MANTVASLFLVKGALTDILPLHKLLTSSLKNYTDGKSVYFDGEALLHAAGAATDQNIKNLCGNFPEFQTLILNGKEEVASLQFDLHGPGMTPIGLFFFLSELHQKLIFKFYVADVYDPQSTSLIVHNGKVVYRVDHYRDDYDSEPNPPPQPLEEIWQGELELLVAASKCGTAA